MGVDGQLSVHRSKHHGEVFLFEVALVCLDRVGVVAARPGGQSVDWKLAFA